MARWFPLLIGALILLLLVAIGYAVKYCKAYWLISGYNTMPEEKKKNVDADGLARFLGNSLFIGCGIIALALVFFAAGFNAGGLAALLLLLPGIVWLIAGAQRFDGNAHTADGRMTRSTKLMIGAIAAFMAVTGVFVAVLLTLSAKPADYVIKDGSLEIKCVFGQTVPLGEISNLELAQQLPEISSRTNGSAMGDNLKGSFKLADGTAARLYLENAAPPFVHFTCGSISYYLNRKATDATRALYDTLIVAKKQ